MKQMTITRILKCAALLLPIVIVLLLSQHLLLSYADANTDRIHDFYNEPEQSMDVVLLGASELFADYSPAYAYEQHGFTSYLYAQDANPGSLYLSQLKEITARQSPDVIFVEINGFLYSNDEMLRDEARLRIYTESIPWSANKIRTIMEYDYADKLSCFFPFIKYHGDWKDLGTLKYRLDMKTKSYSHPSLLKGIYTRTITDTVPVLTLNKAEDTKTEPITQLSEQYLRDFLDYCKAEQLNVVFLRCPHKLVDEGTLYSFRQANRVGEIVAEYGFDFVNLDKETAAIGINDLTDFYNSDHLNVYGQQKLTDYLGKLIVDDYGVIPMKQPAEQRAAWSYAADTVNRFYTYAEEHLQNGTDGWLYETPALLSELAESIKS